jgi:AcrR family transcriptional regulator
MPRTNGDPGARSRILDAADRLLIRYGFRKMSVEDVAIEADVGKGSVYLHFESKEDLALSCLDRMAAGVLDRLRAVARSPRPAPVRLREMLRLRVLDRFAYARPHARSIDEKLATMRQAMLARRNAHFGREAGVFAEVLREGVGAGALRVSRPETAAEALVTATNALLPYSLGVRELGRRAELERRLDAVIDILLAGLAAGSATRRPSRHLRRIP